MMREKTLLQIAIALGACVPVAAGLAGIVLGPAMVDAAAGATGDSHFRYLSGLLLGIGLLFWSAIPRIERRTGLIRTLTLIVVAGGAARLLSLIVAGVPSAGMIFGLVMELAVTPLLCFWQGRVAKAAVTRL